MRRSRRRRHDDTETALSNFALTFAKALLVFCVILFVMISPETKKSDGLKPKMEYMISVEWDGARDYDVDTWIRDPDSNTLYYGNKEVGFLNLERDDLGALNNTFEIDGKLVTAPYHQELVAVRGFRPGEYVLNVHLYRAGEVKTDGAGSTRGTHVEPIEVTIRIEKLNPTSSTKFVGKVLLTQVGEEKHVVRFTMTEDGDLKDVSTELPVLIRERPY